MSRESFDFLRRSLLRRTSDREAAIRLARDQVHEVDRKLRETQRGLKYSVPVTAAVLGAGLLGFIASGGVAAGVAAVLAGAAAVGTTAKEHQSYRALPGYFLWKLKRNRGE